MTLIAFGINHKTAPVEIREKVAFAPEKMESALHECVKTGDVNEAAIVSTCNRTELYFSLHENEAKNEEIEGERLQVPPDSRAPSDRLQLEWLPLGLHPVLRRAAAVSHGLLQ